MAGYQPQNTTTGVVYLLGGGGGGGSVNSVTGTANQVDVSGTTDPVVSLPAHIIQPGTFTLEATSGGNVVLRANGTDALTVGGDSGQIFVGVAINSPLFALNNSSELTSDGATNAIFTDFSQLKGIRFEYGLDPVIQLMNLAGDDGAVIDVKSLQVLGVPGANFGPGLPASLTVVGGIVTAAA